MRLLSRINAWIDQPGNPPDPTGDLLFRANKAVLVYFIVPLFITLFALLVI